MKILGIETTCDETAAAIVENGKKVLSNIVSSQINEHSPWKGVVPEIASRLHLNKIKFVVDNALKSANLQLDKIDLIACANRPGLIGALLVGNSFSKSLAWALNKPFIGINHIEAHLFSPHLNNDINFPYIALLASGGHTMIVHAKSYTKYSVLGTTIDDAVGEAFDKIAKYYDLGYPGGPAVEKAALKGNEHTFNFPISNLYKSDRLYDVSYSGIKTAVIHYLDKYKKIDNYNKNDIAASFQKRAFDILIKKTKLACENHKINKVVVAGGVAANQYLQNRFKELKNYKIYFPGLKYSTDNGAMIAGYAYYKYQENGKNNYDIGVSSRVKGYKISLDSSY
jgi:N6-L-threonylcarbamoyladenine synthase